MKHEDINIANLKCWSTKTEIKLIDEKCNEIMSCLLVKSKELNFFLEDAHEEQDYQAIRLDI